MEIYYSLREIISLSEEGRRGLYKAAKLLKDLDPNDVTRDNLSDFVLLLEKIIETHEEQLTEILQENALKFMEKLSKETLIELVEVLANSKLKELRHLSGLIALRNLEKLDVEVIVSIAKKMLMEDEDTKYIGIALLRDIKKKVTSDVISEILESMLKEEEIDLELLITFLRFFSDKIRNEDLFDYIEFVYQNIPEKEKFIKYLQELKGILPKKILNAILEKREL